MVVHLCLCWCMLSVIFSVCIFVFGNSRETNTTRHFWSSGWGKPLQIENRTTRTEPKRRGFAVPVSYLDLDWISLWKPETRHIRQSIKSSWSVRGLVDRTVLAGLAGQENAWSGRCKTWHSIPWFSCVTYFLTGHGVVEADTRIFVRFHLSWLSRERIGRDRNRTGGKNDRGRWWFWMFDQKVRHPVTHFLSNAWKMGWIRFNKCIVFWWRHAMFVLEQGCGIV